MCASADYVKWAGILMESIMMKNTWLKSKLCFHILVDRVDEDDKEKLKRFALKWHISIFMYFINDQNMESFTQFTLTTKNGGNLYSMYYRWLIPYVVEQEIDKILYIDIDSVCIKNIYNLLNETFDGTILAVRDGWDTMIAEKLKLTSGHSFCSGLVYMNLKKMREGNEAEKIIQYMYSCQTNHIDLALPDQDAGNVILDGKVSFASNLYHYSQVLENEEHLKESWQKSIDNAYFVHLQGAYKPWRLEAQYFTAGKAWKDAQMHSEWKDIPAVEKKRNGYRLAAKAAKVNRQYLKFLEFKLKFGLCHIQK